MQNDIKDEAKAYATEFLKFLKEAYSVFHVSNKLCSMLETKGFTRLKENENWNLQQGGKYFFQRNNTAVFGFTVGDNFDENDTGFKIVAAHLDSPCLQIAPISKFNSAGFNQAIIQTYGGGLWHTWFDRDLNVAGKIMCYDDNTKSFSSKMWNSKKPLMKIANLAIHLQTAAERAAFSINTEKDLRPVISTEVVDSLLGKITDSGKKLDENEKMACYEKHYEPLINIICQDLGINKTSIYDLELQLSDAYQPSLVGMYEEFISSHKLDDLTCSYGATKALIENSTTGKKYIDFIALFDHEEIGSATAHGAKSTMLNDTITKIYKLLSTNMLGFEKAKANSFIISADGPHAAHPNYQDRHQINHVVQLNKGISISFDPGQNFVSSSATRAIFYELCKRNGILYQDCIKRNDMSAGSTLGAGLSSLTSIRAVDVGPTLHGMHSIRETGGILDIYYQYQLDKALFDNSPVNKKQ